MTGVEKEILISYYGHTHRTHSETLPAYDAYEKVCEDYDDWFSAEKTPDGHFITLCKAYFTCPHCQKDFVPKFKSNEMTAFGSEDDELSEENTEEGTKEGCSDFFDWALQLRFSESGINSSVYKFRELENEHHPKCTLCGYVANVAY